MDCELNLLSVVGPYLMGLLRTGLGRRPVAIELPNATGVDCCARIGVGRAKEARRVVDLLGDNCNGVGLR